MTLNPSAPPAYTAEDIENGRIPVLSPEEIRQAELARQQETEQYVNPPIAYAAAAAAAVATGTGTTGSSIPPAAVYNPCASVPVTASAPIGSPSSTKDSAGDRLHASAPAVVLTGTPVVVTGTHPSSMNNHQQQQQQHLASGVRIYSRRPATIPSCPYCGEMNVKTRTVNSPDLITWIIVIVLLIFCWPIFWLPLCIGRCKRTKHICSKCNHDLDEIEPLSDCCATTRH